jgi:hypothetical protein
MASLKTLLGSKNFTAVEGNLEQGKIWAFDNGVMYSCLCNGFCWTAPGAGAVTMDIWGAGGSGSKMCCCGFGLPGNSGAYSRKTFNVVSGNRSCGCVGKSCGNADSLCNRGCSQNSAVCWVSSSSNGCICTQGGRSGTSFCSTTPSGYCCFRAGGFCTTNRGPNCGLVCNLCSGGWIPCGYGGDLNCCGRISCTSFLGCYPACTCMTYYHAALPAGVMSKEGGTVTYGTEDDNPYSRWSGMGIHQYNNALNAASRNPSMGVFHGACWMGNRACGCYQMQGCQQHVPYGAGGTAAVPCPGVRDSGGRGGGGAARIKYVEN